MDFEDEFEDEDEYDDEARRKCDWRFVGLFRRNAG
jgi:hypothetical protein